MGYIGASLAGWGAGSMIDKVGYNPTFLTFGMAAFIGAAFACIIWKIEPKRQTPDA